MTTQTHALIQNEYVEIWVPFEIVKAGDDDGGRPLGKIRGITSSEVRDLDGEVIVQKGLDFSEALAYGYLTHEHPLGSLNVVGFPTKVEPTTVKKGGESYLATLLSGSIYLDDPIGKTLWDKSVTMQKAGGQRALGLSIEGKMKPGARKDDNSIDGIKVKSIAISSQPRNRTSWWAPVMRAFVMATDADHPMSVDPKWLEHATWQAEALGVVKGNVGYPSQGEPSVNGTAAIVPQSIDGKMDSADYNASSGPDLSSYAAKFGLDAKALKGIKNQDLLVVRILKEMPALTWAQGVNALDGFRKSVESK